MYKLIRNQQTNLWFCITDRIVFSTRLEQILAEAGQLSDEEAAHQLFAENDSEPWKVLKILQVFTLAIDIQNLIYSGF